MYKLIRNYNDFEECNELLGRSIVGSDLFLDTETTWSPGNTDNSKSNGGGLYGDVRLIQLYQEGWDEALLIDCYFIHLEDVLDMIEGFNQVWHNASYDLHTINLVTDKPYIPEKFDDTLYLSRLSLWKKGSSFSFYNCLKYCGLADEIVLGMDKKENQKSDWSGALTSTQLTYAACDVLYLAKLWPFVKDAKTTEAYNLDITNLKFAIEYSRRGIPIDQSRVNKMMLETINRQEELMTLLPVNPNSPKQVTEYLGIPKSDKEALVEAKLRGDERAGWITEARSLSKTAMFLRKYNRPIIKGFYNPCGTITGRSSCTGGHRYDHENLQQTPRHLLHCYKAPDGYTFIYKDYAGVELRMAVAWIGCPVMNKLIRDGIDIHSYTASSLYNKPMEDLTKYERMIGKICNFLLIYGGSVKVLQVTIMAWGEMLMDFAEVKEIYNKWFELYPYFKSWHELTARMLKVYGYQDVYTALGRQVRATKLNDAVNIPIQGSCSEVSKVAMAMLKKKYPDENLVSMIHDSITLLCKVSEQQLWIDRLNECMIDAWYYVIKDTAIPDLPMPPEAEAGIYWEF